MKILNLENIFTLENASNIKKWFLNLSPISRKYFLKYFSKHNKIFIFYEYIINTKYAKHFYMRKYTKNLNFTQNYLQNLYIMMSFNKYNVEFSGFYKFWGLNKEEIDYIDKLSFVEEDYLESKNYKLVVKGICNEYYNVEHVLDYIDLKYRNFRNTKVYKNIKTCVNNINVIKLNNIFPYRHLKNISKIEYIRDLYLDKAISCKFNIREMKNLNKQFYDDLLANNDS